MALSSCGLSPEALLERADTAFGEHRYSEARLDLATFLKERPDDRQALELYARTQLHLGDGEGAASTLDRLEDLGATISDMPYMRAEAELLRGQHANALQFAQKLDGPEGARIAALAHIASGDVAAALTAFEEGMARSGETHRLASDFALFALQARDVARAEELALIAREARPDGLAPLLASAQIASAQGQAKRALTYYVRITQLYPENRAAQLGRIGMLGEMGRDQEAREHLEELANWAPDDADVIFLQARFAAEEKDWSQVRDLLQENTSRNDAAQQVLYAKSLIELDLHEQAIAQLTTLVRRLPDASAPRRLLAQAQLETGQAQAAFATIGPLANSPQGTPADLAIFTQAAKAAGRSDPLAQAMANAPPAERVATILADGDKALRDGRWRAAIASYEQMRLWTGDNNALVLNNLAYARSQTGDKQEAISLAQKAYDLAPDHPSIMDTLGWLLVETGTDKSRGLALLEKAAQAAPDNAAIARHLAEARGT